MAPRADFGGEPFRRDRAEFLRQQIEFEREDVGRLRVLADAARLGDELAAKRGPDALELLGVTRFDRSPTPDGDPTADPSPQARREA